MASELHELSVDECWRMLESAPIGRVAFAAGDDVELFPINFHVQDRTILFRSAPGTKLELVLERGRAAFEADDYTGTRAWSVVVHGRAERLAADDDIVASGVLDLIPWQAGEKANFVRIVPDRVSGRRFRRADA